MKNEPVVGVSEEDTPLDAHALYRKLTAIIANGLDAWSEGDPPPKDLVQTLQQLVATMHKLFDIEVGFEERDTKRRSSLSGSAFDLDAARVEISERLARLHSTGGD